MKTIAEKIWLGWIYSGVALFILLCLTYLLYVDLVFALPSKGITKASGEILLHKGTKIQNTKNPFIEIFQILKAKDQRFESFYKLEKPQTNTLNQQAKYDGTSSYQINYRPETLVYLIRALENHEKYLEKAFLSSSLDERRLKIIQDTNKRRYFGWPIQTKGDIFGIFDWRLILIPFTYEDPQDDPFMLQIAEAVKEITGSTVSATLRSGNIFLKTNKQTDPKTFPPKKTQAAGVYTQ